MPLNTTFNTLDLILYELEHIPDQVRMSLLLRYSMPTNQPIGTQHEIMH